MTSVTAYAGTVANNSGFGADAWGLPANAEGNPATNVTNGTYSLIITKSTPAFSQYLYGTNFGFSIPSGSTINGISVSVTYQNSGTDYTTKLLKAGSLVGSNLATAATSPTSATVVTWGGSSNLWGTTWLYSDINNSSFGVAFAINITTSSVNPQCWGFAVTVTYTAAAATPKNDAIWFGNPFRKKVADWLWMPSRELILPRPTFAMAG